MKKKQKSQSRPMSDPEWFKFPCSLRRDEEFAQFMATTFPPVTATDAYLAIYPKSAKWKRDHIHVKACLKKARVQKRIDWLVEQTASKKILTIQRRKEILSSIAQEIGEQDPADYITAGADGTWISFGPESRNRKAIAGIKSRTEMSGEGDKKDSAVITELRLRPTSEAVAAIDVLNKMDGAYAAQKLEHGITEELASLLKDFDQEGFGAPHLINRGKKEQPK